MQNRTLDQSEPLSPKELQDLFNSVGWSRFTEKQLLDSFAQSWSWLSCRDKAGTLIGFVRILSDALCHAYLCSLVVQRDYQGRGIGRALLKRAVELCKEANLAVTLRSKTALSHFYEAEGFALQQEEVSALIQ